MKKYNSRQLWQQIRNTEHGEQRLQLLASAIQEADQHQDHEQRLEFRHEYINESIFHDDSFKAMIRFPEYLNIYDEHPEFASEMSHDMMWVFKNVLENMSDYYQISRAEIENYFEEFKKRSEQYGESLRTYYMKKCKFYLPIDLELARENYEKFRKYPRSSISDCLACEQSFSMECELQFGNEEQALELAKPILDGDMTCAEIPHCTYGELAKYYLYQYNLPEAYYYAQRCEKLVLGRPEFLEQIGHLLEVYSVSGMSHGWGILKYAIPDFVNCKNTLMEVAFARGAYRVMREIALDYDETDCNPVKVYNANLNLLPVSKAGKDGWFAEDIAKYFYDVAEDLSRKLDARNGNTHFMDILTTQFPEEAFQAFQDSDENLNKQAEKPTHGIIRKADLVLLTALAEPVDFRTVAQRLQEETIHINNINNNHEFEKDFTLQICDADTPDDLYLSVKYQDQLYDLHIIPKPDEIEYFYAKSSYNMPDDLLHDVLEAPVQYCLVTEVPGDGMKALHVYMEILMIAFPDLLGVVNLYAEKAYPPPYVRFAGRFPHAVCAYDLFGISITASEDESEVFMTTTGLCTLGMRELEMIGANRDNFGYFANMLDYTALRCVEQDLLPDTGEILSEFAELLEDQENPEDSENSENSENFVRYQLTWEAPEKILPDLPEDSLAVRVGRQAPSAILILTETGTSPAEAPVFTDPEAFRFPTTQRTFHRRIVLAKETLGLFRDALEQGFEKAAVRLELDLDDYGYYESEAYLNGDEEDEPDYSIELIWADIRRDGNTIRAYISEESALLPDCHAGDVIEFTEENTASWAIILPGDDEGITQEEAYLLL